MAFASMNEAFKVYMDNNVEVLQFKDFINVEDTSYTNIKECPICKQIIDDSYDEDHKRTIYHLKALQDQLEIYVLKKNVISTYELRFMCKRVKIIGTPWDQKIGVCYKRLSQMEERKFWLLKRGYHIKKYKRECKMLNVEILFMKSELATAVDERNKFWRQALLSLMCL